MRDKEIVQVIVAVPSGKGYRFNTEPDSEIATRASVGRLTDAILDGLGLQGEHDFYVRVPNDVVLNRLNLKDLDSLLLLPIDVEVGELFRRGG